MSNTTTISTADFHHLISADNHVTEPFDLWNELPEHLRRLAPHVEVRDGRTCWVVEDRVLMRFPVPRALRRDTRWLDGDQVPDGAALRGLTEREQLGCAASTSTASGPRSCTPTT